MMAEKYAVRNLRLCTKDCLSVQQPKEEKVVEALRGLIQSKAQAESIASQLPNALSVAVEKSSRLMAEDLCREAGFMLPPERQHQGIPGAYQSISRHPGGCGGIPVTYHSIQ